MHSPEFAFEKDAGNLPSAIARGGHQLSGGAGQRPRTWTAYRNRYWPAKYLIDAQGTVRAINFGEGNYLQTEGLIRQLLKEANPTGELPEPVTDIADTGFTEDRTPELYLQENGTGYAGTQRYISDARTRYTLRQDQPRHTYSLGGTRKVNERVVAGAGAQVRLNLKARNVYHVLARDRHRHRLHTGPRRRGHHRLGDPQPLPPDRGAGPLEETITLAYSEGVQAYTFTFG